MSGVSRRCPLFAPVVTSTSEGTRIALSWIRPPLIRYSHSCAGAITGVRTRCARLVRISREKKPASGLLTAVLSYALSAATCTIARA